MTEEKLVEKVAREMVTVYNEEDGDLYTDEDWDLFIPTAKLAIRAVSSWMFNEYGTEVNWICDRLDGETKREIASYAREKLKELMNQEQLRLSEDDLSDLLWLVINYGDKLEKYPGENQVENLTTKLEKMLDGMG